MLACARGNPRGRARLAGLVAVAALALASAAFSATAQAATFTVGTTNDTTGTCASPAKGACSLRQLITYEDGLATTPKPPDRIDVPANSYFLSNGPLTIDQGVTIAGAGARTTSIFQGTTSSRVFDIVPNVKLGFAPTVIISGLGLFSGHADSTNGGFGGDIRNQGTLTLSEDEIGFGTATGGSGGGISNYGGTLTVTHSLVANDQSNLDANGAGGDSGGIQNYGDRSVGAGVLKIDNSTITANTAALGGGIMSWGNTSNVATITNSTIAGNDGGQRTDQTNAGGLLSSQGTVSVENSIVAFNTTNSGKTSSNCGSSGISSLGNNLETAADCGFKNKGDLQSTDPKFLTGSLADNGGNTDSFALQAASPAIDVVSAASADCTGTDQRDIPRPQGNACDIGADELFQPVEGQQFSEVVGAVEPGASATIDWGDGTGFPKGTVDATTGQVTGSHTYAEEGVYHGTINWTNSDGFPQKTPFEVKVQDASLNATATPVSAIATVAFNGQVATFTDADPGGIGADYAATIDWGDGTVSAGTVSANGPGFAVSGSHTYSKQGAYQTIVSIGDTGGSKASGKGAATVAPPAPTVTSLSPTSGPAAGGTSVTITGTNFTGATGVKFGSSPATSVVVVSDSKITATSPAGAGTVDVTVTTPTGTSLTTLADHFAYAGPVITAVTPASGPGAGSTPVTIIGTNFTGATGVKFGSSPASGVVVVNDGKITATSPAGAGTVDVTVTSPGGTSPTGPADHFAYAGPNVGSVTPSSGPGAGGTPATITGTNFTGATAVNFGANAATGVVVVSDSKITATAPAGSGIVDVTVTSLGGTSATGAGDRYTYIPAPTISAVSPSSGPTPGGTSVTITGTGFTGATAVSFGATPASGSVVNSATQITATTPPGSGIVDVAVTTPGGTSATSSADHFGYNSPPPVVVPGSPASNGSTAAGFAGAVDPNGLVTTVHWVYGLDPKDRGPGFSGNVYDQSTPNQLVGPDFSSHGVLASVSNLLPNALYHLRLVAASGAGTTVGPDQTFMTVKAPAPPPPVVGKTENLSPIGSVFVLQNGVFVALTQTRQLPTGTEIDALHGSVNLVTSTGKKGKTFTGTFGGAVFRITQTRFGVDKGLTTLSLVEGAFSGAPSFATCKAKGAADGSLSAHAALSSRILQTLRSRSRGRFRTRGRYAAGTVRGTQWTTTDRCDGTLIAVQVHTVLVTDLVKHITIAVHTGHSYLAKARKGGG